MVVTLLFQRNQIVMFHNRQLAGLCSWAWHDQYASSIAPYFFVMLSRRDLEELSRPKRNSFIISQTTVFQEGFSHREMFAQMLSEQNAQATTHHVPGGIILERSSS